MARNTKADGDENALARGMILDMLQATCDRHRDGGESIETYLDESVIFSRVGRRYPQSQEMVRGKLFYLKDKGYVKSREVRVGKELSLMWRITAVGTDLLEGNIQDAGVRIE